MARKRTALAKTAIALTLVLTTLMFIGGFQIHWVGALSPYALNFLLEALDGIHSATNAETS